MLDSTPEFSGAWELEYERHGCMFQEVCALTLPHSFSIRTIVSSSPLSTCHHLTVLLPLEDLNFLLTSMATWAPINSVIVLLTVMEEDTFLVPQTLRFPGRGT